MTYTVVTSSVFDAWLAALRRIDRTTYARIVSRIARLEAGNFGDAKSVGGRVSELRLDFGAGYRVYYTLRGLEVVLVLCGGDKKSQQSDIALAQQLVRDLT